MLPMAPTRRFHLTALFFLLYFSAPCYASSNHTCSLVTLLIFPALAMAGTMPLLANTRILKPWLA